MSALMTEPFKIVIPARYASSRFPGKVLADIHGKPMVQYVYERAKASGASEVWIATDDERVCDVATAFGAKVCMTSGHHQSGSDRIAEVADRFQWPETDIVVNVQGDEPLLPQENIAQVAKNIGLFSVNMATLCVPIEEQRDIVNPGIVKVVFDCDGYALYFSRSGIPYLRDDGEYLAEQVVYYRHIGIYAFRVGFLKRYTLSPQAPLERIERLEQLRALWHGERIHVAEAICAPGPGIDTPDDLKSLLKNYSSF